MWCGGYRPIVFCDELQYFSYVVVPQPPVFPWYFYFGAEEVLKPVVPEVPDYCRRYA